jgi:uncharacterized membrane protein
VPRRLLWIATAAYAAGFGALSWTRHLSLATGRFDLGNMTQAVWSTAHGRPLEMTGLHGEQISRLGAHVDPILAGFAPLWWLWPDPALLLVAQSIAVALGAPAVYALAQRRLASERAALGCALAYLLYPPLHWLTVAEFHPVALAAPLLLWAFNLLDEERTWAAVPFLALAALTKEEVGLVVAAIGLWYALRTRRPAGLGIAAAGAAWSAFAIAFVVPHFNEGASSAFYGRYDEVGGSPGGIARTLLTDPVRLLEVAFDERGLLYLLALLAPLLGLSLISPLAVLVAAPELAINLLSATRTQTSIHFHYTAAIIPALVVAAVYGLERVRGSRLVPVLVAACVAAGWWLGPLPFWQHVPGGEDLQASEAHVTDRDRAARRLLSAIPGDAAVSATNYLGAHLSARERIFSFPERRDATWLAVDTRRPSYRDDVTAPERFRKAWAEVRRDRRWAVVVAEDGVYVLRRGSSAAAGTP